MKTSYLILLLLFVFTGAWSKTVPGYIVTLKNDTVAGQIKIPKQPFLSFNPNKAFKSVEMTDSSGSTRIYTANDIKAVGYTLREKEYILRAKPVKDGSLSFLTPVIQGRNTTLYQFEITSGGGQNVQASTQEFYTFEKADSTYLFLTNYASLQTLSAELKSFYKDYPAALVLIDEKFTARRKIQEDIREVIAIVNRSDRAFR